MRSSPSDFWGLPWSSSHCRGFWSSFKNLPQVYHGIATPIQIDATDPLFKGLGQQIDVGRYHSWVVDPAQLPEDLLVRAHDDQNQIMALRHRSYDLCSVQFHPESILTPSGMNILKNWLNTSSKDA